MTKFPMKQIACAVLLSGACVTTQAATTDLGTIDIGAPTNFNGSMIPAGSFSDIFTFILPANGGSGYSVLNFPLSIPSAGVSLNTVLSTLSLVSDPDGTPFSADDSLLASAVSGNSGESVSLVFGPTGGGSMYLNVTGITNGDTGGIYGGSINVSPVPEPEVWAMMLVGVGLVGFRLRNRSKKASAARFA